MCVFFVILGILGFQKNNTSTIFQALALNGFAVKELCHSKEFVAKEPVASPQATKRVGKALHHSVHDGIACSLMTSIGETYFSAFALIFKFYAVQFGLLCSLPSVVSFVAQRDLTRYPL